MPGPELERMKKNIVKIFKDNGLQLTIETNLIQVNFLDVTLNLSNGKYWPYRKQNDLPLYIHIKSKHPPNIIKDLPKMIENRLSDLSCNKEEFNKIKPIYDNALSQSGFNEKIKFTKRSQNNRNRQRKIIWFNPPFNSQTKTNIGKDF